MAIKFEILRRLAHKAELQSPLKIEPTLPFINTNSGENGRVSISISVPKSEGDEFIHWRLLQELNFIRVRHDGLPGFGVANNRVEGLTAKGQEFVELSRDDAEWNAAVARCNSVGACTVDNIVRELRKAARTRLNPKNKMKAS